MKVYELLEKPESWVKHYNSLDANNKYVTPDNPAACKWCLLGAVFKCYPDLAVRRMVLDILEKNLYGGCIWLWNDSSSIKHQDVLDLCRKANV